MNTKIIKRKIKKDGYVSYDVFLDITSEKSWDYYSIYIPSLSYLLFESLSGKYSEEYEIFCKEVCSKFC